MFRHWRTISREGVVVNRCSILLCVTCLAALVTFAQEKPATQAVPAVQPSPNAVIAAAEVPNNRPDRQDYRIGAEDLLDISVFDVPEMSRTVRVSAMGTINLPLLGQIQ